MTAPRNLLPMSVFLHAVGQYGDAAFDHLEALGYPIKVVVRKDRAARRKMYVEGLNGTLSDSGMEYLRTVGESESTT